MEGLKVKKGEIAIGYRISFFVLKDVNTSRREGKPKHGDVILRRYTHCRDKEILDYTLNGDESLYTITIRKSLSAGLIMILEIPVEDLEITKLERPR